MKQVVLLLSLFFSLQVISQNSCSFSRDTLFIPKENKVVSGEYLQATLKNNSVVQLFRTDANKYYMKLTVTENLYFDRVDMLEIRSGEKSFWVKDAKQHQLDKHSAYYVVELFKNYAGTLKDEGITAIAFNKSETKFSKQDRALVKQISKCFYETITAKK